MSEKTVSAVIVQYTKKLDGLTKSFVLNSDEESLHQLRVNMRRLHNALWLFQTFIPKKTFRRALAFAQIDSTVPGHVRDLDVRLGLIKPYAQFLAAGQEKTHVTVLLSKIEKEKAALAPKTVKVIRKWRKTKPAKFFKKVFQAEPFCCIGLFNRAVYAAGKKKLHERLLEFLSFAPFVDQPQNIKKLHQMRIAAKHLRYTLEEVAPLYDPVLTSYITEVGYFHRALGDIHDLDISIVWLSRGLTWQKGNKDYFRSLNNLQIFLAKKREKVYGEFVEHWNRCRKERVFEELLGCVYSVN